MSPIQAACYSLLASSFLLAGMLVVRLGDGADSTAYGAMVTTQQNVTIMTARTRDEEESLFVLDNPRGALLIYTPNVRRNELNLVQAVPLNQIFAGGPGAGGGGGGR